MSNLDTQTNHNAITQELCTEPVVCNNIITTFASFIGPDDAIKSTDVIADHAILADLSQLTCSTCTLSVSCVPTLTNGCGAFPITATVYAVKVTGCIPFIVSAPITEEASCNFTKNGVQTDGTPLLPTTSVTGIAVANNFICISSDPDICTTIQPLLCNTTVEITELFRCVGPDSRGKSIQLTFTLPSCPPV